jgi:hypothetical protein
MTLVDNARKNVQRMGVPVCNQTSLIWDCRWDWIGADKIPLWTAYLHHTEITHVTHVYGSRKYISKRHATALRTPVLVNDYYV